MKTIKKQYNFLIILCLLFCVLMGLMQMVAFQHHMSPDGISYIDMGEAFWSGNYKDFVNAYWSPMYPFIQGFFQKIMDPASESEFFLIHTINFFQYLIAFICFHLLLAEMLQQLRKRNNDLLSLGKQALFMVTGYFLFTLIVLRMITVYEESPDILVAMFVFLDTLFVLKICSKPQKVLYYILLSISLGFGYYAKVVLFPIGFVFLAIPVILNLKSKNVWLKIIMAGIVYLLIVTPWALLLSQQKSYITFGDSGKLNYAWYVNGAINHFHWQGEDTYSGKPNHPTRKIHDTPDIFEFKSPVYGTYPVWYDATYWHHGIQTPFVISNQIEQSSRNVMTYLKLFTKEPGGILLLCFLVVFWVCQIHNGLKFSRLIIFVLPGSAAIFMYVLCYIEPRMVAPYLLMFYLGLLYVIFSVKWYQVQRALCYSIILYSASILMIDITKLYSVYIRDLMNHRNPWPNSWSDIAYQLNDEGLKEGNKIAIIGKAPVAYWARSGKFQIVAELPHQSFDDLFNVPRNIQEKAIHQLLQLDIDGIVAERLSKDFIDLPWKAVEGTDLIVLIKSELEIFQVEE